MIPNVRKPDSPRAGPGSAIRSQDPGGSNDGAAHDVSAASPTVSNLTCHYTDEATSTQLSAIPLSSKKPELSDVLRLGLVSEIV